ncbi:DUF2561 family protein [Mycobacterium sp. HUMS_1102779]|uniref:DUF2561 family protein n=1 Tax=Mycobacterium sp. HUMS_1102779 TaxID=3383487 RepID=UPI00389B10CE
MVSKYSYRRGSDTIPPEAIDRLLIGACAAIWLVVLGVSVAAAVALVDLGRGFHKMSGNSTHTTWVLYTVIIVSALIIAGAIPVLLRARRTAQEEPPARPTAGAARGPAGGAPLRTGFSATTRTMGGRTRQPRVQAADSAAEWSGEAVDRVWLRGTVLLAGTMGVALVAVATATYLMAVGHDGPSWVGYGLAGAVTAGMPVIEFLHVRQLRRLVAGSE